MKLVSLSLPLIGVCSDTCDSEFSSALQTNRRTSGTTPCVTVQRGAVAPVHGIFRSLDGSFEAEAVDEGAIAPVAGKFCVGNEHAALLERARSRATAGGQVESSLSGKDDFALKSLGPFNLVARDDLTVDLTNDEWSAGTSQGSLARTLELDNVASYSWLGAKEIDWAYQPDTEPAPEAGSFEKYGGFVLKNSDGETQHVLQIDNFAAADDILMTVEFSDPFWINQGDWNKCKNPAKITIPALKEQGALEYCWATSRSRKECNTGCFIYKTEVGEKKKIKYQGFSVMKQYPLKELGPFHLHARQDLVSVFKRNGKKQTWEVESTRGQSSGSQPLDDEGSNFWQQAVRLEWAYQAKSEDIIEAERPFEKYGGFVLLGSDDVVMDLLEIGSGGGDEIATLSFGDPFWINKNQWKKCSNPAPITIAALSDLGAEEYCWFTDDKMCERGCFYYKTVEGYMGFSARGFALPSLGPFPLVSREDLTSQVVLEADGWSLQGGAGSGELGSTLVTDEHGQNFWFGSDEVDWAFQNHEAADRGLGLFEQYGGFVLRSGDSVNHVMEIDVESSAPDMTLHFSMPFHITEQVWGNCKNPAPITIKALSDAGAQEYCWEVASDSCPNGCFLYKTTNGYQAFAAKDFALPSLGPFPLVARSDLLEKSEFPTLVSGQELMLDADAEKEFWLGAASVTWMFPKDDDLNRDNAVGGFEKYGGFLLKDADGQVVNVLEIDTQTSHPVLLLNFADPMHIPSAKFQDCLNHRPVTIQTLVEKGTQEYCWEGSAALESCQVGCFLYMTDAGYQAFSIRQ